MTDKKEERIITPEQRRAKEAWGETEGLTGDRAGDFANQCKQTSVRILNSGILPTLAFLHAHGRAGGDEADQTGPAGQTKRCADALAHWLICFVEEKPSEGGVKTVLEKMIKKDDVALLRRVQTEALAYLHWLARLAEGRSIESDSKGGGAS